MEPGFEDDDDLFSVHHLPILHTVGLASGRDNYHRLDEGKRADWSIFWIVDLDTTLQLRATNAYAYINEISHIEIPGEGQYLVEFEQVFGSMIQWRLKKATVVVPVRACDSDGREYWL